MRLFSRSVIPFISLTLAAISFVDCADKEDRIQRIMKKEQLSYDEAKEKVEKTDEERASYYYEHTGKTWGDVNDYHMIIDTSQLGVENCADILMHYFEKLEYI